MLYVTLEPCCHYGKTPPCTEAILEHKVGRVVIGSRDPNPLVAGRGVMILRDHGIAVTEGVLKEECDNLNRVFFHYIEKKRPYVVMKYAMTMDGKIATVAGKSRWITGEAARERVHLDRNRYMAIMAGVQTVLADDPMLNCRIENGRNPVRIICDTTLRAPLDSNIVTTAKEIPTILATCCMEEEKIGLYRDMACQVLSLPEKEGHVDLAALMEVLGGRGIDSILLEGGGILNEAALKAGIVNLVQTYIAPKIFGGATAPTPVSGAGVDEPDEAYRLRPVGMQRIGEDILLESEVIPCSPES